MASEKIPLYEHLRILRAVNGLSFDMLSARSHVDVAYLHRLETGKACNPSRDVLFRIALGLGLDVEMTDELIRIAGHVPLLKYPSPGNYRNA
jgi:transcriptional regulator with XRE-family HTH domain